MEYTIEYIKDEEFVKLTKKQKLEIKESYNSGEIEIDRLVIVPINQKSDGWSLGSFFARTPNKGWWRPMTYDCWSIKTEIDNPVNIKYNILRGDFENGGLQIFSFVDEYCKAYISYGGEVIIRKK